MQQAKNLLPRQSRRDASGEPQSQLPYCAAVHQTRRWKARPVRVGSITVGGDHPIRLQSMTSSDTRDVHATVEQIKRLADHGCEIARVTVQGMKEAQSCEAIKEALLQAGYTIPLVADIHFYPPAAMQVVDFVEKVRINPGNFADRRAQFRQIEYTDAAYATELEKITERFAPLVEKCKRRHVAMRIGANHGSLSDRIMNRYGDTPRGMVESVFEYTRVARSLDYHDIIFSMKSSNPRVMIGAYRLLVAEMTRAGWDYPLHLGVTEAGEGEDGRIKSAIGIGSLLLDGLGDTIRVSLTEDPWEELDPCKRLVALAESYYGRGIDPFAERHRCYFEFKRRPVMAPEPLHRDGSVFLASRHREQLKSCKPPIDHFVEKQSKGIERFSRAKGFVTLTGEESEQAWRSRLEGASVALLAPSVSRLHVCRRFFDWLQEEKLRIPVILHFTYDCSASDLVIQASAEAGALLCDGLGEGLFLDGPYPPDLLHRLSFALLQAARMRATRTDFISCPSCGRTLFDLQDVSKEIRARTAHLPGVKIAIMGCIVNGPGEMADADFGYVGSKPDKVNLYVGTSCVERDIDDSEASDRLVALIKKHGRWVEPACLK